jgi:murein DD-endopeptidase MepM/ murein hydrolase activator NlpD
VSLIRKRYGTKEFKLAEFFFNFVLGSMKRIFILLIVAVIIIGFATSRFRMAYRDISRPIVAQEQQNQIQEGTVQNNTDLPNISADSVAYGLVLPIGKVKERVTKKPFGTYITSKNSPVQPEIFSGYHTGTDFETFPEEQDADVPVYAIAPGKIVFEKWASGYGGVLAENGEINGQTVTIIYGHLNLGSINKKTGENFNAGELIGFLGKGYSQQTDGERKHLHLGIHRGTGVDIKGYVINKEDLNNWIDFMSLISNL